MIQEIADNAGPLSCLILVVALSIGIVVSAFRNGKGKEGSSE